MQITRSRHSDFYMFVNTITKLLFLCLNPSSLYTEYIDGYFYNSLQPMTNGCAYNFDSGIFCTIPKERERKKQAVTSINQKFIFILYCCIHFVQRFGLLMNNEGGFAFL